MMFQRISRRIAFQFTAVVFGLLLFNGLLFLVADISNAQRMEHDRLIRTADVVQEQARNVFRGGRAVLPLALRETVRIVDVDKNILHEGELFRGRQFSTEEGFSYVRFEDENYTVLTLGVPSPQGTMGYVQVALIERGGFGDLPLRAVLYLLVSVAVSALIFAVGRFFANRSLRPAEQAMAQLEQFTQDASHELRTPLAALSSSLDLALKSGKYKEGIESAKDDLKEAAALLERLLEIARLGPVGIDREAIDLSGLTEQVIERFRPFAKENDITIESTLAKNVTVQADVSLLRQVLNNLLANAVKFKKEGKGTVTVKLTKETLSITDTGIGISKESLPHIFDRFFQADASRRNEGHGLGLSLVRRIVELHGWTIAVRSKLGEGTTFTIRFS